MELKKPKSILKSANTVLTGSNSKLINLSNSGKDQTEGGPGQRKALTFGENEILET